MEGGAMTIAALKTVFDRAQSWSDADQMLLARAAELIEAQRGERFELTSEDWAIIDKRIAAAEAGDVAANEEAASFFAKYKRA
jgi:hypothetical protein